jgi:hypothetical protein
MTMRLSPWLAKPVLRVLVVAIFGDPQAAAVVPAEGHRLSEQGLGGGEFCLEAGRDGHLGGGLFAGEEGGGFALGLGEAPEHGVGALAGVGFPRIGEREIVEGAGVDDELVADDFGFALGDGPIAGDGAARADAHLAVDAPGERVAGIFRMIEHGDVGEVGAAIDFQADIDPEGALAGGAVVALAVAVDHAALQCRRATACGRRARRSRIWRR